jgi:hypothetical protein
MEKLQKIYIYVYITSKKSNKGISLQGARNGTGEQPITNGSVRGCNSLLTLLLEVVP